MKTIQITIGLLLAMIGATSLRAQISAFTYQGQLNLNGAPANGYYDFMFRLLNDPTNGVAAPVIPINLAVLVTNGLFTTGIDFGAENFDGANRWLEINARTNGGGPFTTLSPRQVLFPTPYAIAANTASNLTGALPASQISGTILNTSLPPSPSFSGTVTANGFSGNGASLANVNATTLGGLNSSSFWRTTGNAGTTTGTHFLGTTDDQPLELKVNNQRGLRLEPAGSNSINVIGGWIGNFVAPGIMGATIGGGGAGDYFGNALTNTVEANLGTVAGGAGNAISPYGFAGTIGGGFNNTTHASYGIIGGGYGNSIQASAWYAAIGGGFNNSIESSAAYATISGGSGNRIQGLAARGMIGGGGGNVIQGYTFYATIGGGGANAIETNAWNATVGGGWANTIQTNATYATIGGGSHNSLGGGSGTIAGGQANFVGLQSDFAAIGGGFQNWIGNQASAVTIAGGYINTVQEGTAECSIGGGRFNTIGAGSFRAVIAGGYLNQVGTNSNYGVVGGGWNNTMGASSLHGTIAGGAGNDMGDNATSGAISGGWENRTGNLSDGSALGGGKYNLTASNSICATIPGGENNFATSYAFAAGRRAKANDTGAFVWGDSTDADITSTNADSVTMRASGGYRLFTDTNATTGAFLAAGSGSWTSMSDRNAKENLRAADTREILERVVAIPVRTWNYKAQNASIRHIGPMAQDFKAAFGVGESDTGIATVDADGVALAAIQGLNQKLEEARAENVELKKRLTELERAVRKPGRAEAQP